MKRRIKCIKLVVKGGDVYCNKYNKSLGDVIGYTGETCNKCKYNGGKYDNS